MPNSPLRRNIKAVARRLGFDVIRFHPESSDDATLALVFKHLQVDLVLDVGANEGQYVGSLRERGYVGRVVSFEPLSSAYGRLSEAARGDPAWTVHRRCAIGASDGEISINIAGNNVSSSVLPMLSSHTDAAPESRYIGSEQVPLARLDTVAPAYLGDAKSVFLKIDTQGFEASVLDGAAQLLQRCRAVQLEMSLVPLYDGQQLWPYFVDFLQLRGFVLWTVLPGFVDPGSGRTLQMDAVFARA